MVFLFSFIWIVSCVDSKEYHWHQTRDGEYSLWVSDTVYEYLWEGESLDSIPNGSGKLTVFQNDSVYSEKQFSGDNILFYGAVDEESITEVGDDFYVGEINEGTLHGVGVYKVGDSAVYIGAFKKGSSEGKAKKYVRGNLKYDGDWVGGKKHGFGIYYQEDGTIQKGYWVNDVFDSLMKQKLQFKQGDYLGYVIDGKPDGSGKIVFKDSSQYKGSWKDGEYEGEGMFTTVSGDTIEGYWSKGKMHGEVSLTSRYYEYEGSYNNGNKEGYGMFMLSDGTIYSGEWKENEKNGFGELIIPGGISYEGEWIDDVPSGLGKYEHFDEEIYNGEWKEGAPNGEGEYENYDYLYEGNFVEGVMQGFGKIEYKTNCDEYEGYFKAGLRDSIGVYKFGSGNIYEGHFKNDLFEGQGVFTYVDGSNYQGEFSHGVFYGTGTLELILKEGSVLITGNWNGDKSFPEVGSVLFSNGDLYEGPLVEGHPTDGGIWSTEKERDEEYSNRNQGVTPKSLRDRAFNFYDKHKNAISGALEKATEILDVVETAAFVATLTLAPTGVGGAIAGAIFIAAKGLNVAAHAGKVAMSGMDLIEALGGGETAERIVVELKNYLGKMLRESPQHFERIASGDLPSFDKFWGDFILYAKENGVEESNLNKIDGNRVKECVINLAAETAMTLLAVIPGAKAGKVVRNGGKIFLKTVKKPLFAVGKKFRKRTVIEFSKQKGGVRKLVDIGKSSLSRFRSRLSFKRQLNSSKNRLRKNKEKLNEKAWNSNTPSKKTGSKKKQKEKNKKNEKDNDGIPLKLIEWQRKQKLETKRNFIFQKNNRSISIKLNGQTKGRVYAIKNKVIVSVSHHFDGRKIVNPILLGPLIRNATYKVQSVVYKTDSRSRPKSGRLRVIAKGMFLGNSIDRNSIKGVSESGIAEEHDRINGKIDHGGHLIAHKLGGVKANINIVPQLAKMNVGPYKIVENFVRKNSKYIKNYYVRVNYIAFTGGFRPDSFYQSFYFLGDKSVARGMQLELKNKDQKLRIIEVTKGVYKCILGTTNDPKELLENEILEQNEARILELNSTRILKLDDAGSLEQNESA